jgi:putative membrane protein
MEAGAARRPTTDPPRTDDDITMRTHRWAATALTCLTLSGIAAAPALAADAPPTDYALLRAAHQGNLTETAAGRDARKNATTACVKKVGGVLERDHTKLDAAVRALADKLGVDLPAAPTPEQQQTLAALMAKAGTSAYDPAWLKAMDAAHTKTLAMLDHQIAEGKDAEITAGAKAVRPIVAHHLAMVRGGTCHEDAVAVPDRIHAGSGGQVALADEGVPVFVAVPAMAIGGVLVAGGAFWAAGRIRRNDVR